MKLRLILLFLVVGLAAAAVPAQTLDIDFDKSVSFANYKTYMWGTGTPAPNPVTAQRIIDGVEKKLAAAGWQKVESNADVLVIYHVSVAPETTIKSYAVGGPYNGYQWGLYGWDGSYVAGGTVGEGTPTDKIQTIDVGQLVIDIADAKTKNFIWRGSAKDTLKDRDPNKIKKKVENAIGKLFKKFPPAQ